MFDSLRGDGLFQPRHQVAVVRWLVGHVRGDDHLMCIVHYGLPVEALDEAVAALHDVAFGVREVALALVRRSPVRGDLDGPLWKRRFGRFLGAFFVLGKELRCLLSALPGALSEALLDDLLSASSLAVQGPPAHTSGAPR